LIIKLVGADLMFALFSYQYSAIIEGDLSALGIFIIYHYGFDESNLYDTLIIVGRHKICPYILYIIIFFSRYGFINRQETPILRFLYIIRAYAIRPYCPL